MAKKTDNGDLPIPAQPTRQEFCAGVIPICPVCERDINVADKASVVEDEYYHGPCSRFANASSVIENMHTALYAIGNEVGRPTTHYAAADCQLVQQTEKLDRIFVLVSKALGAMSNHTDSTTEW